MLQSHKGQLLHFAITLCKDLLTLTITVVQEPTYAELTGGNKREAANPSSHPFNQVPHSDLHHQPCCVIQAIFAARWCPNSHSQGKVSVRALLMIASYHLQVMPQVSSQNLLLPATYGCCGSSTIHV